MTTTDATVRHLTHLVEGVGHKLFMDNFFIAKQKNTPWLWTEKIEIEKGRHTGKSEGNFDCVGLEGQTTSRPIRADQHKPTTKKRKFLWRQQPSCEASHRGRVYKLPHGVRRHFWSYGQSYSMSRRTFKCTIKIVFPPSGSDSTQTIGFCYLRLGQNICTKVSDTFWWGIWSKKPEKVKIVPPPAWLEGRVRLQQI